MGVAASRNLSSFYLEAEIKMASYFLGATAHSPVAPPFKKTPPATQGTTATSDKGVIERSWVLSGLWGFAMGPGRPGRPGHSSSSSNSNSN